MRVVLKNFRLIDEAIDTPGGIIVDDGIITGFFPGQRSIFTEEKGAAMIIDGSCLLSKGAGLSPPIEELPVLMPAFVDLHAHFRDPGLVEKTASFPSEVVESASFAAAAGGFGTVVCMANTKPAIDSLEKVLALKKRSQALGLIDLYPVMSLTKGMEGKELSGISALPPRSSLALWEGPWMLSEDGKDIADDDLFLGAMKEAKRIGVPISCHCDFGGDEAERLKEAGQGRDVWSRVEENNAVRRVIDLGKKAGCHIHIAHVSTKEAVLAISRARAEIPFNASGFLLTCEVMPHNLSLTEEDAVRLGNETWGRVNPPLRCHEDRQALIRALADGTIDAISTDHAPHSDQDKEKGAPGFSGFETAFAAAFTELVRRGESKTFANTFDLKRLSSLMSAGPARLLGFGEGPEGRGRLLKGYRADLVSVDPHASWIVDPQGFKTRGKNSPFANRELFGKILITIHKGRVVFEG